MSWGNPLAALLALGILVPLVLHLWHRHTTEHQSFPALAWVRRAEREHGRALRTRNLTLMLLRIGSIAALALAAARPAARLLGVRSTPRTVVLLIDNTMSSGAVDGGATVLDAARRAALALLDEVRDAERAWVVTADGAVLGGTVTAARAAVAQLAPIAGAGELPLARTRALALASAQRGDASVAAITDGQPQAWASDAAGSERIAWLVLPPRSGRDHAVIDVRASPARWTGRGEVQATLADAVGGAFRVEIAGRSVARGSVPASGTIAAPVTVESLGWFAGRVELEPDGLRANDARWFAGFSGPPIGVRVDATAGRFVRGAVDALLAAGRVRVGDDVIVTSAEAAPARAPALLLAPSDPVRLAEANRALERRGVPWRFEPLREGAATIAARSGAALPITSEVRRRYPLRFVGTGTPDTVATVGGEPWIVAGDGYVLIASPMDPAATAFPLTAAWLPWLASTLAERLGPAPGAVNAAEPDAMVVVPTDADGVELPDGSVRAVTGGTRWRAPASAGVVYWRRGSTRIGALVLNPASRESDATRLAASAFAVQAGGATGYDDVAEWIATAASGAGGRELAGALAIVAMLALLGESWLVRRARER